jgi:hypothetical protein
MLREISHERLYHFVIAVWRAKAAESATWKIGKALPTIWAKPDGVGAVCQQSIVTGEQFGLLTPIAMMESGLLCTLKKSGLRFWNLNLSAEMKIARRQTGTAF